MRKQREDLIDFVLMMIVFIGAATAGATILAAEINQVFTYISTRLATYTTQGQHLRRFEEVIAYGPEGREKTLCEMRFQRCA